MILVDSNVLMYAIGSNHPNKPRALAFLDRVASGEVNAAIDTEVLQEILHRYQSLHRWSEGAALYSLAREIFSEILPVDVTTMDIAKQLLDGDPTISGRDAVHAAVVSAYKLDGICSFDRDFDRIAGCKRIKL